MAKLVMLIETEDRRGKGVEGDPVRLVKQWFTLDGELVTESDPWLALDRGPRRQPSEENE